MDSHLWKHAKGLNIHFIAYSELAVQAATFPAFYEPHFDYLVLQFHSFTNTRRRICPASVDIMSNVTDDEVDWANTKKRSKGIWSKAKTERALQFELQLQQA